MLKKLRYLTLKNISRYFDCLTFYIKVIEIKLQNYYISIINKWGIVFKDQLMKMDI
jgi:hypothetical protein